MVSSDFIQWIKYIMNFLYDFFYSVNMPGLNIPVVYFFILVSVVTIVIGVLKRMLFSPSHFNSRPRKSKGE